MFFVMYTLVQLLVWLTCPLAASAEPPPLLALLPTSGPVVGGTRLTFSGAGLTGGTGERVCRFGHDERSEVVATVAGLSSHGWVYCLTPTAHAGYEVNAELSIDGGNSYLPASLAFTYYFEAVVSAVSPNAGPAAGSTLVRVSGYNFAPTPGMRCLFAWRSSLATYIDFQTIKCASPEHAANSSIRLSFDDAALGIALDDATVGSVTELAGAAAAAEGVLWLGALPTGSGAVTNGNHTVGSGCGLVGLRVARDTHAQPQGFAAQFELLMRGNVQGLSFSYGALGEAAAGAWGVEGVARGLTVSFWGWTSTHFRPYAIEVVLDGVMLERAVLGSRLLLSGAWAEVSLRLDPLTHVLTVQHDGVEHLAVHLPAFAPAADYHFALSGCVVTGADATTTGVLLDSLAISASSFYAALAEPLHVTLNGDSPSPSASASSTPFAYHAPARLDGLSPSCGPALGRTLVTVSGIHLGVGDDLRCRFGTQHVPASHVPDGGVGSGNGVGVALRCQTPALVAGTSPQTEITLNGQDHTASGARFYGYPAVQLVRVSPTLAPEAGGTLLSLHGGSIGGGCDYRCRFSANASIEVAGTYNSVTGGVECYSPPLRHGEHAVQLTLNGRGFSPPTAAASLLIYPPIAIDGARTTAAAVDTLVAPQGPRRGGTVLLLRGSGFGGFAGQHDRHGFGARGGRVDDGAAQCMLGASLLAATIVDDATVRCTATPMAVAAGASVSFDATLRSSSLPDGMAAGGAALPVGEYWAGEAGFLGGYLQLSAGDVVGAGGALLDWQAAADATGCEPPLRGCRHAVRASARAWPRLNVFSCAFRLRLGGAIGVSWSFGNLLDSVADLATENATAQAETVAARLGESGAGDGLRLLWRVDTAAAEAAAAAAAMIAASADTSTAAATSTSAAAAAAAVDAAVAPANVMLTLSVVYQLEPKLTVAVPVAATAAEADGFVPITVRYDRSGLRVTHGGAKLVSSLQLPGWDPTPGWRVGLGARAAVAVDEATLGVVAAAAKACAVRQLSFRGGAAFSAQPVELSLTLNNQDMFSVPAAQRFVYTAPRVSAIVPASGPAEGGLTLTLRGSAFDGGWAYACRFGLDMIVPANFSADKNELHCVSPVRAATELFALEASLDGETFTSDGATYLSMWPVISSVQPRSSPPAGGSRVTVRGLQFGSGLGHQYRHRCRFGNTTVVATYVTGVVSSSIVCDSPNASDAGMVPLLISLDAVTFFGAHVFEAASFTYTGDRAADAAARLAALLTPPLPPAAPEGFPPGVPPSPSPPPSAEELRLASLGLPRVYALSPSSGDVAGGTVVTVTGGALTGGDGYMCRFGTLAGGPWRAAGSNAVPATLDATGSLMRCNATSAALAAATVALWRAFDGSDSQWGTLFGGDASISGGRLQLGRGGADATALSYARFPIERPLHAFTARFLLRVVAGGAGGMLSFHYGAMPHYTTPPDQGSAGLQVVFDGAVAAHAVEVRLDGATLWRQSMGNALYSVAASVPVLISVAPATDGAARDDTGRVVAAGTPLLTVTYGGITYVDTLPLRVLRLAEPTWQLGFVARGGAAALTASRDSSVIATATVGNDGVFTPPEATTGAAGDIFSVEALEVEDDEAAAAPRLARVPFAVSINAQQFSADAVAWTYLAPPSSMTVSPSSGSHTGGTSVTISGAHIHELGSHLLCSFGVEPGPAEPLGGAAWAARPETSIATHLAPKNAAAIEGEPEQGALICLTPIAGGAAYATAATSGVQAALRVSLNGQQFSRAPLPFVYFGQPTVSSLSPACGPATGGTLVVVSGAQLTNGSAYRCRFGSSAPVEATYSLADGLRCFSPSGLPEGINGALEVSLNALDYTVDGVPFAVYEHAATRKLQPRSGPASGSTALNVSRSRGTGCDHRCRFGGTLVVGAAYLVDDESACGTPPIGSVEPGVVDGSRSVEVSLNAQQYSSDELQFDYFAQRISSLTPPVGPIDGGTAIQLRGAYFARDRAERVLCGFGIGADSSRRYDVAATLDSDGVARCRSPPRAVLERLLLQPLPPPPPSAPGDATFNVPAPAPALDALELSLNGREFSSDQIRFTYAPRPRIVTISPMLGPALGGTRINVTATGLGAAQPAGGGDLSTTLCRFELGSARRDVIATHAADGGIVACVSPALHELGASGSYAADFSSLPPRSRLRGGARLETGHLRLAESAPHLIAHLFDEDAADAAAAAEVTGAAEAARRVEHAAQWILEAPLGQPPLLAMRLSLVLLLDGRAEHGMCLSFAPPQAAAAPLPIGPDACAGAGLRVLLHVSPARCETEPNASAARCVRRGVRVRLDGALLLAGTIGRQLVDAAWAPLALALRPDPALELDYAGERHVASLPLGWTSKADWSISLASWRGADTSGEHSALCWVDDFELRDAALLPLPAATAELSVVIDPDSPLNPEGVYISDPHAWETYAPTPVHQLTPASGPAAGSPRVVVDAFNLNRTALFSDGERADLRCRFGDDLEVVATYAEAPGASHLLCHAPLLSNMSSGEAPLHLAVRITTNGQQYGDASPIFVLHPPPVLRRIEPSAGPAAGGTRVRVGGLELQHGARSQYRCRFGSLAVAATLEPAGDAVRCTSPPQYAAVSAAVAAAAAAGDPELPTATEFCRSELEDGPAVAFRPAGSTVTVAPSRGPGDMSVRLCTPVPAEAEAMHADVLLGVTLNDQDYHGDGSDGNNHTWSFRYVAAPRVNALVPASGPSVAAREVAIRGAGFSSGVEHACRFGVIDVVATRVHSGEIRCLAPVASTAGLADALEVDFGDPLLLSRGAAVQSVSYPLRSAAGVLQPAVYVPPDVMVLSSFRIVAEPAARAEAGTPFAGALQVELLDQRGDRFPEDGRAVMLTLLRESNESLVNQGALHMAACAAELTPCSDAQAAAEGVPLPGSSAVASTAGGLVSFGGLLLHSLGGGVHLKAEVAGYGSRRTNASFEVVLGPAAKLLFVTQPDERNLMDTYFDKQPIVQVTDLGGNRVRAGLSHIISLDLFAGEGRLRGPKTRYSRNGMASFDRLRIKAAGYDKQLRASAPGLAPGYTNIFGIEPHGIPHTMRFVQQPPPNVLSGETLLVAANGSLTTVAMYDVYGELVSRPPAETLAPYVGGVSPKALEDVCDMLCRAHSYPLRLTISPLPAQSGNPHLTSHTEDADALFAIQDAIARTVSGVAAFRHTAISLRPNPAMPGQLWGSSRAELHVAIDMAADELVNQTAIAPDTSNPLVLMRPVDRFGLGLCNTARSLFDHNTGTCVAYPTDGQLGAMLTGFVHAGEAFSGPLVKTVGIEGDEIRVLDINRGSGEQQEVEVHLSVAPYDNCSGMDHLGPDEHADLGLNFRARQRFIAVRTTEGCPPDDDIPPVVMIDLPGIRTARTTDIVCSPAESLGSPDGDPVCRQVIDFNTFQPGRFAIEVAGVYMMRATSPGLADGFSRPIVVLGADPRALVFNYRPAAPQPYNTHGGAHVQPFTQKLSVQLLDRFGNHNTSTGTTVEINMPGAHARFLDDGWLTRTITRQTVDGVADFSDVEIVPPLAFSTDTSVVQAIHVDGFGPSQGSWGFERGRTPIVSLKGIEEAGELVLMPSRLAAETRNDPCLRAGDVTLQEGDYAYPPEDLKPAMWPKYKFDVGVWRESYGYANFTIRPLPPVMSYELKRRYSLGWYPDGATPLEEDVYTLCFKPYNTFRWVQQRNRQLAVGPGSALRVLAFNPPAVYPGIEAEIQLQPAPTEEGGYSVGPGDLVAIRTQARVLEDNCTHIRPEEYLTVSANMTVKYRTIGQTTFRLCVRNISDTGEWATTWDLQMLPQLFSTWTRNQPFQSQDAVGPVDGVYTRQRITMEAGIAGVSAEDVFIARISGMEAMMLAPPGLPVRLQLDGPAAGSSVVRDVPFEVQPVLRVVGVYGEVYTDVNGRMEVEVVGDCGPQLSGTKALAFEDGVARFTDLRISTFGCLNQEVYLSFELSGFRGNAGLLQLPSVESEVFVVGPGEPYRVQLEAPAVELFVSGAPCVQVFKEGEAALSAVVRDAQGSPVDTFEWPVDLRLCEAAPVAGGEPLCPARGAALTGEVQKVPTLGRVEFRNFSVTNISYSHVLLVFANQLLTDHTEPFAACDRGFAQELAFVQQAVGGDDGFGSAALPLALQPVVVVRDGFGTPLSTPEVAVSVRVLSGAAKAGGEAGGEAQLRGATVVHTTLSDPLRTNLTGQYAVFADLSLGTAGTWTLIASSDVLDGTAISEPITITPSAPHSLRFTRAEHGHAAPGSDYAVAGEPIEPGYVVQMLDASGNNVTISNNESAFVELLLPLPDEALQLLRAAEADAPTPAAARAFAALAESGETFNTGSMAGVTKRRPIDGVVHFDNISFDLSATRKVLTAHAVGLGNATARVVRVRPTVPHQMQMVQQPRALYARAAAPPALPGALQRAGGRFFAADGPDLSAGRVEAIDVELKLLDRFGNEVCDAMTTADECEYTRKGWHVGLALMHDDLVNYTIDHLSRETRTRLAPLLFERGAVRAIFRGLRVYRTASQLRFNASLLWNTPFDPLTGLVHSAYLDAEGLPNAATLLPYVLTSPFDVIASGAPARLAFVRQPARVYQAGVWWASTPAVEVRDIYGRHCLGGSNSSATWTILLAATNSTGGVVDVFDGWGAEGGVLKLPAPGGNASVDNLRGVAQGRGLRMRAEFTGSPEGRRMSPLAVTSAYSDEFDLLAPGVPFELRFSTQPNSFVLTNSSFERQPQVETYDVTGARVAQAQVQVELAFQLGGAAKQVAVADRATLLLGNPAATTVTGVASFEDVGVRPEACAAAADGGRCVATLVARSTGLLSGVSEPFEVVGGGAAVQLAFSRTVEFGVLQLDAPLPTPVVVHIVDPLFERVNARTARVHVCLHSTNAKPACVAGAAHLLGSAVAFRDAPGGAATFDQLVVSSEAIAALGNDGHGLTLVAASPGLGQSAVLLQAGGGFGTMTEFSALAPGVPVRLAFSAQGWPEAAVHGSPLEGGATLVPAPEVEVLDVHGARVPTLPGAISLQLLQPTEGLQAFISNASLPSPPPAFARLRGNLSASLVGGIASFGDVSVDLSGGMRGTFSLVARGAGVLSTTSSSFDAYAPGAAYGLRVASQPLPHVPEGWQLPHPLKVRVVDLRGEVVRAASLPVQVELGSLADAVAAAPPTPPRVLESTLTDVNGTATFAPNISGIGHYVLRATSPTLASAQSQGVTVLPAPARLPCPAATCQWASSATSGEGELLPLLSADELLGLGVGVGRGGGTPGEAPERATGPPDMEGCALANEGRTWQPLDGSARWLLVGFARPDYARGVAVYESGVYGAVDRLVLLDEHGEALVLLDVARGDRDDADCVHTPLHRAFAPTRVRIAALWLLVGGNARRDNADGAHAGAPFAQIDAVQLLGTTSHIAADAVPLRATAATRGVAVMAGGELHLTAAEGGQSGAFTLHLPAAYVPRSSRFGGGMGPETPTHVRVSFDMYVGGGDGGDGLSFCYGELPAAGPIGEAGVGSGICLTFASTLDAAGEPNSSRVEARYGGTLLATRAAPLQPRAAFAAVPECDAVPGVCVAIGFDNITNATAFSCAAPPSPPAECEEEPPAAAPPLHAFVAPAARGSWRRVVAQVLVQGLSLWLDDTAIFERAPLPGWAPVEDWGFGFGARTGARRDSHRIDNVRIERGVALEMAETPLTFSTNGQQFAAVVPYVYHAHPAVSRLAPAHGPAAGGTALTLHGSALRGAQRYRCRFTLGSDPPIETVGSFAADDSSGVAGVLCPAPTRAQMNALGASWSPSKRSRYMPTPTYRPAFQVWLRLWREELEYAPRSTSTFELTPTLTLAQLVPASGPMHGGTSVLAVGDNLAGAHGYACRFSAMRVPPRGSSLGGGAVHVPREVSGAYVAARRAVRCEAPRSPAVVRSLLHARYDTYAPLVSLLAITLNAAQYEAAAPFRYYAPPGGLVLHPDVGPDRGGTEVLIAGANLTGGTDARCRFAPLLTGLVLDETRRAARLATREVAATLVVGAAARLRCLSPPLPPHVGHVTIEVSLNGQQFSTDGAAFSVTTKDATPPWFTHRPYEFR